MKIRMNATAAAAAAALVALAGCASTPEMVDCSTGRYVGYTTDELFPQSPRFDCGFGESVNMAVARQVVDKDAGAKNAGKGAGIDGVAAKEAMSNYQKSFRSPEPPTSPFVIGISGSGSAGQ